MKHSALEILFDDDDIVVVSKPAGLLTLPDRFDHDLPSVRSILLHKYGDIFTVHRLDRETSGVLVFAKHAEAHKNLNDQFQERQVRKLYHAVVVGVVEKDEMDIDIPLEHDPVHKGLMRPTIRGKESLTVVRVLERYRVATLLECDLRTGRQHQIRVHCSAIGHPLLVDKDYGGAEMFLLSTIKRRYNLAKHEDERPIMSRVSLHAFSLSFAHPASGETMTFESVYPKDFAALLQVLGKYSAYRPVESWDF